MIRLLLFIVAMAFSFMVISKEIPEPQNDLSWWEKRNHKATQAEIYYPHNKHMQSMDKEGDSCMLCHTFNANNIIKEKHLKQLTTIANEPLEKICHDCHVDDLRAPWRCNLCHSDATKIWPDDHNFSYIQRHSEDARRDETVCQTCHLDMSFCTDCHFKRDSSGSDYHPMEYQSRHGIDARMMGGNCGRCHNSFFCSDCHRSKQ